MKHLVKLCSMERSAKIHPGQILFITVDFYLPKSKFHSLSEALWGRKSTVTFILVIPRVLFSVLWDCVCSLSRVRLFVTPGTVARRAPLSMGFSRQEHWSGLPCPSPGNLPHPGIKPAYLVPPALANGFFTAGTAWSSRGGLPTRMYSK